MTNDELEKIAIEYLNNNISIKDLAASHGISKTTLIRYFNGETNGVVISQTVDPENPIIMILDEQMDMDEKKINKMNLMLEKNVSILQVV